MARPQLGAAPTRPADAVRIGDLAVKFRVAQRDSGDVTVPQTAELVPFDTAMDLSIPAAAGDLLEVGLNIQAGDNAAYDLDWNVAVLVNKINVRQLGGSGAQGTIGSWATRKGDFWGVSGTIQTTALSSDITGGAVALRLLARSPAGPRKIFAKVAVPARWSVKNLGPAI